MPIRYRYDSAADLVRVDATGAVTGADVRAYYEALAHEPWIRAGMRFLADNRGLSTLLPTAELQSAALAAIGAAAYMRGARVAVLVPDPVHYGLVRQFEVFSEQSGAQMRPFYREDEAMAWLGQSSGRAEQQALPARGADE